MKCKDWGDIDADLAESILHLVLNCKTDVKKKYLASVRHYQRKKQPGSS